MNERQELNRNLAQMLKGGVIMDVTTPEQAKNAEARERIRHALRANRTGELNAFGFVASKVAWDDCEGWLNELRTYLHGNYSALLAFVRKRLPALRVASLEATYLAWVDISALNVPSAELARRLEQEAKVKFSPGAIYGEKKDASYLRINLACSRTTLLEALERTAGFINGLKRK